jgi:hypothetical protein
VAQQTTTKPYAPYLGIYFEKKEQAISRYNRHSCPINLYTVSERSFFFGLYGTDTPTRALYPIIVKKEQDTSIINNHKIHKITKVLHDAMFIGNFHQM